ncbi:MAG: hypothetical protein EF806_00275 [Candidatus Methanoliparum thermophilum]|uniref:Uncharacterized protein n=1 Tax=Methanoliparum thermophilum TaxID=2491083 RepID=A0A520KTG5_METT2|nr:hypothetical protein [Candidatus Methanoliparum sp. LAM-1]RZN65372.1 MAG: hypothetical protein EF806_00275 [Candidatus Methanoliparum thermophilum]
MADKGICIDNIARQFGLACRTINTWIRLARTFPSEERCTEFAPSFYQRLLKYNDPVKALQICREIHKIDPDIIWWATGNDWSRRLFDQKVPVSKLQNVLNQLEKENSERTEQPADFIDPEWLKEITIRLAELERELQAARRLNQTCLKMLCNPVYKKTN